MIKMCIWETVYGAVECESMAPARNSSNGQTPETYAGKLLRITDTSYRFFTY